MTRFATKQDIPEIVRIINLAFRVEDFFIDGDRTNAVDIGQLMADPAVRFIVIDAPDSNTLSAAVVLDVHQRRGHFAMLAVDPAVQGQGLARRLMNAVDEYCRDAGCEALDIDVVNLREELPAFYTAMGFEVSGSVPFPDTGKLRRDAHMVRMTKSLA